jgi:hypothetical protein
MKENTIHICSRGIMMDAGAIDPRPHPEHYYELNASFYDLPGGHIQFQESA